MKTFDKQKKKGATHSEKHSVIFAAWEIANWACKVTQWSDTEWTTKVRSVKYDLITRLGRSVLISKICLCLRRDQKLLRYQRNRGSAIFVVLVFCAYVISLSLYFERCVVIGYGNGTSNFFVNFSFYFQQMSLINCTWLNIRF